MKQGKVDFVKNNTLAQDVIFEHIESTMQVPFEIKFIQLTGEEEYDSIPNHWHRHLELVIPVYNGTLLWADGQLYSIAPGMIGLVNTNKIHNCRSINPGQKYTGYAVQLDYDFVKSCYPQMDSCIFDPLCTGNHEEILDTCTKLIDLYYSDDPYKLAGLHACIYRLVYLLLKHNLIPVQNAGLTDERQKKKITEILTYIDEHCDEITSVGQIADTFHISYGYLAKLFKDCMNISLLTYLNQARIHAAEKDLISSDATILDICTAHGFSGTKSFYKEFARYHDISPREFRRRAKEIK